MHWRWGKGSLELNNILTCTCMNLHIYFGAVVVQFTSKVLLFATPWTAAHQATLSSTISRSFFKFMSIESLMLSNHFILFSPLLLLSSVCTKSGSFLKSQLFQLGGQNIAEEISLKSENFSKLSFSISTSNEYSELISFRIDWFDHLAVQRTLKTLLQHHNLNVSIIQHSAFFMVQLSHPYMTTEKVIALTICTIVSKVMSLFFNMLSRFAYFSF